METLEQLIEEQRQDMNCFKVKALKENHTYIRPNRFRFDNFAGETPKQKAYSILKYLCWEEQNIIEALSLGILELIEMRDLFDTHKNEELGDKFFEDIPLKTPKLKAVIILLGLHWKQLDICKALNVSRRTVNRTREKFNTSNYIFERR